VSRVIAIFGPTAIGKTQVAIALGEQLAARGEQAVAISADAIQVYSGIELLSGAPTVQERARLEHRLVSFLPLADTYSAGAYARDAHHEIDAALAAGLVPIVVGGTGLYLRAALAELEMRPPVDPAIAARLAGEWETEGPGRMHGRLAAAAPQSAAHIAARDRTRVLRALALIEQGIAEPLRGGGALWDPATRHPTRLIGLTLDPAQHRERIERRIDAMLAAGALAEAQAADRAGASDTARQALGFDDLLRGDTAAMRTRTHHYAKRQRTWLRRLRHAELIDVGGRSAADVAAAILDGR